MIETEEATMPNSNLKIADKTDDKETVELQENKEITVEESKPSKPNKKRKYNRKAKPFEPRVRLRYEILLAYKENPKIPLREMKDIIGLSSLQSVHDHIGRLRREQLLKEKWKKGENPLTSHGETLVKYVEESAKGESLFVQYVKKVFGSSSRSATQALNDVISELDKNYTLNRNGAVYYDGIKDKYVLERKVSAQEVIKAARKYPSIWMAASATGLVRKSYEERLQKIFRLAKEKVGFMSEIGKGS